MIGSLFSGVNAVNCLTTFISGHHKLKFLTCTINIKDTHRKKENKETKKYFLGPQTKKPFNLIHCEQLNKYDTTYF